jgi:hypothetical protein
MLDVLIYACLPFALACFMELDTFLAFREIGKVFDA